MVTVRVLSRSLAVLAACAVVGSLAIDAAADAQAAPSAGARMPSLRTVTLITGDAVAITQRLGHTTATFRPARDNGAAGSAFTYRLGTDVYVVPGPARRYLGGVLDRSLFDLSSLAGRPAHLPVTVALSSSSAHPSAPGLVITSRSGTSAQGYLDAAHARAFGDALLAQWRSDTAAHRVPTSIFGGVSHLALAGVRAPAQPQFPQVTLTIRALDGQGRPADFADVGLINVDDGRKYANFLFLDGGQANVSVPKGHYSLIGDIDDGRVQRIVPVSDFAVTTNHQVFTVDGRKATVTPTVATPRPATEQVLNLEWDRSSGGFTIGDGFGFGPDSTVKIAPAGQSPYGTTDWLTQWVLAGTPTSGLPYTYDLSFHDTGGVPADQSRTVPAYRLATVNARYYSDGSTGTGAFGRSPLYPFQFLVLTLLLPLPVPSARTEYVYAPPGPVWLNSYNSPAPLDDPFGGTFVFDGARVYAAGTSTSADWLDGALTPGVPEQQNGDTAFQCWACRDAKHLSVALLPTTDSDPGHFGFPSADVRFRVWRNATSLFDRSGFYGADLTVPTGSAVYRVREDVDRAGGGALLSTQVSTDVSFRSAAGSGARLPDGWFCDFSDTCLVQPMLAARIPLPTDLSGAVPRGPATITFTVRHIQGAPDPAIGAVHFLYAVDGGAYTSVPVTSLGGHRYRVSVNAPRNSTVSVRVTASDAAGGSLVQTATDAYRVSSS